MSLFSILLLGVIKGGLLFFAGALGRPLAEVVVLRRRPTDDLVRLGAAEAEARSFVVVGVIVDTLVAAGEGEGALRGARFLFARECLLAFS